jgi:site-specific DNA-methyltransferase (adenine-specific)
LGAYGSVEGERGYGDQGGASRFFPTFRYQAKAPTRERPKVDGVAHPTVKPLALMRWLVRLVTPPGGTVLDPFAGSGTTLQAARDEGFAAVGIEREGTYLPLIAHRLGVELAAPAEPTAEGASA